LIDLGAFNASLSSRVDGVGGTLATGQVDERQPIHSTALARRVRHFRNSL